MIDAVYVGLGSNMQTPEEQLKSALQHMNSHESMSIEKVSHFYLSAPMGPQDQASYVNAVCKLHTSLAALDLLEHLQEIENVHGRIRQGERWGPRTLDLDILLFNNLNIKENKLTVPHYGMAEREFVLVPLFEIEPDMIMHDGRPLSAWVADCPLNGLKRLKHQVNFRKTKHDM